MQSQVVHGVNTIADDDRVAQASAIPRSNQFKLALLPQFLKIGYASFLFEGTCTAEIFTLWLSCELCPLSGIHDVVTLDNATFHKSRTTRDLVAATGATLLFLPPYSPDLNPIEHDFGALKKICEYNHETPLDQIIK